MTDTVVFHINSVFVGRPYFPFIRAVIPSALIQTFCSIYHVVDSLEFISSWNS